MRAGLYNISATAGIGVKSSGGPSTFGVCCISTLVANQEIARANEHYAGEHAHPLAEHSVHIQKP
jgi:hypothetical protein